MYLVVAALFLAGAAGDDDNDIAQQNGSVSVEVRVVSQPEGAQVYIVTESGKELIGETPLRAPVSISAAQAVSGIMLNVVKAGYGERLALEPVRGGKVSAVVILNEIAGAGSGGSSTRSESDELYDLGFAIDKVDWITRVAPEYPMMAKSYRIEGEVEVEFIIGIDGQIESRTILAGNRVFYRDIEKAIAQWKAKPVVINGEARRTRVRIRFNFDL